MSDDAVYHGLWYAVCGEEPLTNDLERDTGVCDVCATSHDSADDGDSDLETGR